MPSPSKPSAAGNPPTVNPQSLVPSQEEEQFITAAEHIISVPTSPIRARVPAFEALVYKNKPTQIQDPRRWVFAKLRASDYLYMFAPPLIAGFLGILRIGGALPLPDTISPAQIWETVALLSTFILCYTVYTAQTNRLVSAIKRRGGKEAMRAVNESDIRAETERIKWRVLILLAIATILFFASCFSPQLFKLLNPELLRGRDMELFVEWFYVLYVFLVVCTVFCFQSYDLQLAERSPVHQVTGESVTSLVFASIPVLASMVIIFLYLLVVTFIWTLNPRIGHGTDIHAMHDFIGGAIAFQMLVSNIIFVIVSRSLLPVVLLTLSGTTEEVEPEEVEK